MHNLWAVVRFEFLRTIRKKSFWISTLAVPTILAVVLSITIYSGRTASRSEDRVNSEQFSAAVMDESGYVDAAGLAEADIRVVSDKSEGERLVRSGEVDSFIYFPKDPSTQTIEVFGQDTGLTRNSRYTAFARQLLRSNILSDLERPEAAALLQKEPAAKLVVYDEGAPVPGIERAFVPGAFLVLFYLVIILLGNHMLTSTTDEKENRVMEIILTSIKARALIIGKIASMIMVGILQILVISVPMVVAFIFFRDDLNLPQINLAELVIDPVRLATAIALFIFSFLLFTGLLVTIGAVMPTAKEAGGFFGIGMFLMFVPLYAIMAIITDPEQTIVKFFSFFPLTAPITLLVRNAVGNLSAMETVIGLAILAVSGIAALFIAVHAFRHGTLEYERKVSIRRLLGRSS